MKYKNNKLIESRVSGNSGYLNIIIERTLLFSINNSNFINIYFIIKSKIKNGKITIFVDINK